MKTLKKFNVKFITSYLILIGLFTLIVLTITSCYDDEDNLIYPCGDANGENCEDLDSSEIQEILDLVIYTPLGLANRGVPLDSLYGKNYLDGIVFYVDVNDEIPSINGMLAAKTDMECEGRWEWEWECKNTVPGLSNVPCSNWSNPPAPDTTEGALIGDGKTNTDIIVNYCDDAPAKLCREIGDEWFLPSKNELIAMYTNLHSKGHGGFITEYQVSCAWYCTSSEDDNKVWIKEFITGAEECFGKHP